ncbi:MAG: helix-turn-helix domain-containing protein [Planctomycetota bacterium]
MDKLKSALADKILGDLVTDLQLAQILDLSATRVQALFRTGAIPGRKVGRRWVTSRAKLVRWLESSDEVRAFVKLPGRTR